MENGLMLGNEAVARAAWEAGVTVASAYPGTPSTEITEYIAKYEEIYCEWAPNEKVAMETALGASIAGARSICAMKHVGLNVAADPLFTSVYTGVNGGFVIVVADDPGMHSSQNEQDSRYYGLASKTPVFEPSDSQECYDYVKAAFETSEEYDTPVMVRLTTRVAHSRSLVFAGKREERALREYKKDAGKYVMMPAMARNRQIEIEKRLTMLSALSDTTRFNVTESIKENHGAAEIGVITAGIASQYTREALARLPGGAEIPVLKLGLTYPMPRDLIRKFAGGVKKIVVAEELSPFIEDHVRALGLDIPVIGKGMLSARGELSAATLVGVFAKLLGSSIESKDKEIEKRQLSLPARPPVLCPGCPHRGLFYVLKRLKLTVCGDIGCYTLGALPPLEAMDTCVCMGASISVAHGMDKARGSDFASKCVAVIGDSTFLHTGMNSLLDVVYNKGNTTVLILDNSITGMTGHQENPSTGKTIRNEPTARVNLEALCGAIGVPSVRVEDPFEVEALEAAIKEELAKNCPSVIIVRRPCALIRLYEPYDNTFAISSEKCTRCKMCMRISCAAISDKEGKMEINESLCAKCGLCAKICRFGAISNNVGGSANG